MSSFTHIDSQGRVRMVDVSDKPPTLRTAVAQGTISMKPATFDMIQNQTAKKGNVLETARIAGIMGAKRTSDLIPMCHPLPLECIEVEANLVGLRVRIVASARCLGKTRAGHRPNQATIEPAPASGASGCGRPGRVSPADPAGDRGRRGPRDLRSGSE